MSGALPGVLRGLSTPIFRVTLGLVCLTISLVVTADFLLDVTSSQRKDSHRYRRTLASTLAAEYSGLVARGSTDIIRSSMQEILTRDREIASAAVRSASGEIVATAGDHARWWAPLGPDQSTINQLQFPIVVGARRWGTLELAYRDQSRWGSLAADPLVRLVGFIAVASFLAFFAFLRRTLRVLDPTRVVPERVSTTLDVLAEGVLLLDDQGHIVLANAAFADRLGRTTSSLLGADAAGLGWSIPQTTGDLVYPWVQAQAEGRAVKSVALELPSGPQGRRTFVVNCTPICDDGGAVRGVAVTFDDVTEVERTNAHLRQLTRELEGSRQEVERQNGELMRLAMRDPLTGVLNRRALFEQFDALWSGATDDTGPLGCVMVDIDRFKSFNDRYGHAVGDEVIKAVARELGSTLRLNDVLGRYGGEEFCIVLPGLDDETTARVAERMRGAIEAKAGSSVRTIAGLAVTASFGVASWRPGMPHTPAQLVDRADQALVAAKQAGRDRVLRWDQLGDAHPIATTVTEPMATTPA